MISLNKIKDIAKEINANAVRFIYTDYDEYNCKENDCLNNKSSHWISGVPTSIKLDGLCFILIEELDHVYCYDKLLFTNTNDYIRGNDPSEIIIKNPKIIKIVNKIEKEIQ